LIFVVLLQFKERAKRKKMVEMTWGKRNLLIDCHSFSALPNLLNSNPPDIDISMARWAMLMLVDGNSRCCF